jgi:hypothetical protein
MCGRSSIEAGRAAKSRPAPRQPYPVCPAEISYAAFAGSVLAEATGGNAG